MLANTGTSWIIASSVGAGITLMLIRALSRLAPTFGLLDMPDERKCHQGAVPMVGGLAIGIAYLVASTLLLPEALMKPVTSAGICLLLCVGAVNDRITLRPRPRLVAQFAVALTLIVFGGMRLTSFGNLFGLGEIVLPTAAGVLFTMFFVVSLINGFNMLDGLDGLAGGIGAIVLIALSFAAVSVGAASPLVHMIIFLAGLLGFLLVHNIRSPLRRRLVFLGDSGSMVLGFVLAWSAITFAEHPQSSIYPISIVWVFGIVVLDTIATVIRRVLQRRSPLAPARDHVHHLLLEFGMSPQQVVWVMYGAASIMAAVGFAGWAFEVKESLLTISFIALSAVYYAALDRVWRRLARRKSNASADISTNGAPPTAGSEGLRQPLRAA